MTQRPTLSPRGRIRAPERPAVSQPSVQLTRVLRSPPPPSTERATFVRLSRGPRGIR